jgi:hypothetical protein
MSRREEVYSEYQNMRGFLATNITEQDRAIIQLSVAIIATLGAFGKDIILANKTLAIITIVFFVGTVVQTLLAYYFSNSTLSDKTNKLREILVYKELTEQESEPHIKKLSKTIQVLNHTSIASFMLGLLFFTALLIIYIGEL